MSKKIFFIVGAIVVVALAAGVYVYKKDYFNQFFHQAVLTPEKVLSASFVNKNPNLSAESFQLFQQRFNETKDVLQKNPDSFENWLYLGVLKKGIGDYEGARDAFIYAGQIRPKASTPFANLADLYAYFLNDPVKAEASIKTAIANDPADYNLYIALADIYRYKFVDGGAKYEQTMLEANTKIPDNTFLISSLAAYFRDTNQTIKAIEGYEKLVKLLPDNVEAKRDLAELKAKQ